MEPDQPVPVQLHLPKEQEQSSQFALLQSDRIVQPKHVPIRNINTVQGKSEDEVRIALIFNCVVVATHYSIGK